MLALLVFALALRFHQIGEPEVWLDELALRGDAFAGTNKTVSSAHNAHLKPVGFLLRTFGNTPTVLRTWGAILCALGAVLCCVLGTWVRGPRVGVAFGVIAVVNPYLVLYSQDGNYYGGMFFYSVVQLCGLAGLLRGGVKGGFLVMALAGWVGFYNHPMSICLTAMVLFAGLCAVINVPELRSRIVPRWAPSFSPKFAAAVIGVGALIVGIMLRNNVVAAGNFILSKVAIGGTLTNIEFGRPFFEGLFTSWGVTHFRENDAPLVIAAMPLLFAIIGLVAAIASRRRARVTAVMGWLCLLAPIATFLFIFNIDAKRGFYIRYLTFLLPLFLLAVACGWDVTMRQIRWFPEWKPAARGVGISIPMVLLAAPHLRDYYRADLRNYVPMVERLAAVYQPGDPIWNVDQWLRVARNFPDAGLPDWNGQNTITTLFRKESAPLYPFPFAVIAYGRERFWVQNSWREAPSKDSYEFFDKYLEPIFVGRSGQSWSQNARLYELRDLAPALSGIGMTVPPPSGPPETTPLSVVDIEDQFRGPLTAAQWPDHEQVKWLQDPGADDQYWRYHGWRERNGSWDFIVTGKKATGKTMLNLIPMKRSEESLRPAKGREATTQRNPAQWLAVAVNGVHQGFWVVESGYSAQLWVMKTNVLIPFGNSRISITGLQPRLEYTPYDPWGFYGIGIASATEFVLKGDTYDPAKGGRRHVLSRYEIGSYKPEAYEEVPKLDFTPSLESTQPMTYYPDWREPNGFGEAGGELADGWFVASGKYPVTVSEDVTGPSGKPAMRIDFPADTTGSITVLCKPFAVQPGGYVFYSTHMRSDLLSRKEALPCHVFLDKDGRQMPYNIYAQMPAMTGNSWPDVWRRFLEIVPVPEGAVSACVGVTVFPRDITYEPQAGTLWIDAFASPANPWAWRDPVNPLLVPTPSMESLARQSR